MNLQKKVDFTVDWLRALANNAGADGLLVGVSGGVDSALVAFLIKKAFPENSLGVILPCKSNPQDQVDAKTVVEAADLKHIQIDLSAAHDEIFGGVQQAAKEKGDLYEDRQRLGDANLRARLRMSTLYTVAANYNYLVVGTDNAAEWHLGYFTKYGDGGVDCVPIANLTKGEVRQWAEWIGVPQSIIQKAPSAGLWEGQTDEEEMGTTYEKVDLYLKGKEIPEQDKQIIEQLHKRSAHKRQMPPKPPLFK
ncbi:NAD(+) synthase [Bacillus horti]|uniref:NH(3)-dependent NAD(+) synthetase n=1 Tax=Caldalkalibacillus horti TaxID=77523 RepID=A0ABT9VTE0_9BACI|nr:NAD(+) synthase [Bacillus horti]MDQ0164258.1 NAD+ synthase [Bacillus horti]